MFIKWSHKFLFIGCVDWRFDCDFPCKAPVDTPVGRIRDYLSVRCFCKPIRTSSPRCLLFAPLRALCPSAFKVFAAFYFFIQIVSTTGLRYRLDLI
jgi:hypothetical protein